MTKPAKVSSSGPPVAQPPAARPCHFCGIRLEPGARYCAACERYQPDPAGTDEQKTTIVSCRACRELIPRGAETCNHCNATQSGIGSWLPTSSAGLAALSALVSLVILLLNTIADWEPSPRSKTDLELYDADLRHLYVRLNNQGTMPAFAGRAWFRLAAECDWQEGTPAGPEPCAGLAAEPQNGVLELKVPRDFAVAKPGPAIVPFERQSDFDEVNRKPSTLDCADFAATLAPLKACLAFEVIEHQRAHRRCLVREIPKIAGSDLLFVKDSTCKGQ